jgi:hypothetical protein
MSLDKDLVYLIRCTVVDSNIQYFKCIMACACVRTDNIYTRYRGIIEEENHSHFWNYISQSSNLNDLLAQQKGEFKRNTYASRALIIFRS